MFRPSLAFIALLAVPTIVAAASLGTVTKALRPQLRSFDAKGQPLGPVAASSLKLPAPIVAFGVGGSIGVAEGGKTIFLRGLDVETTGVRAACAPVQATARASGSAYAASNMGLGGAADCQKQAR
jgi:hypothetical protein